jgi:outer membrane receptor protein involved in Fe transport
MLSGASLAAMGAMSPAAAQDLDVSDEIVVTATGRAAAIQDVPLAVQAIGNAELEQAGVQSLADVTQLTPTLRLGSGQSTTSGTIASIRGIGTGSDNPGFEGAVGIFIDGVYRARAGAALADLPDVERIEVLRGPQGTLFGRNTSAGAISVVTAAPDFDFGAWGEMEFAERGGVRGTVGMTGPVTDTFALRFDATGRVQDGYIDDVTSGRDINDTDRWNARLQALWDITPDATLRVIVDGGQTDENCCGAINVQSGTVVGALAGIYFPGALLSDDESFQEERRMTVSPERSYAEAADDFGVSAELNWDIGGVSLTSITAYRDWTAERDQDIDFTSLDRAYRDGLTIDIETISQELRLQGEWGRVNWLVGAFVSHEEIDTTDRIRFGADALDFANAATFFLTAGAGSPAKLYDAPVLVAGDPLGRTDVELCADTGGLAPVCTSADNSQAAALLGIPGLADFYLPDVADGDGQQADNWNVETESYSLFTHNEIALTDALMLTIGARYVHETKDLNALLDADNDACEVLQTTAFGGANLASAVSAASGGLADVPFALACNAVTNTLANGAWSDSREEDEWSGTVSLAYDVTDDLLIYAGYSRGYKAGGFNLDRSGFFGTDNLPAYAGQFDPLGGNANASDPLTPSEPLTTEDLQFEPEFTDAYEIGFKSTIFGGTTTFNAAIYYQQIHDYQSNSFSGFNFFTLNVDELISQGVELELSSRPTDNLTLVGGIVYNDAYYDTDATFGGSTIEAGTTLAQAPEWTVTGSANYRMPLTSELVSNFYISGRWVSDYATMTLNRNPVTDNDAFAIFDARVSLGSPEGAWSAEIFVQNLTDEFYYVGGFGAPERTLPTSIDPDFAGGNYLAYPNRPRTVGLTLRARY